MTVWALIRYLPVKFHKYIKTTTIAEDIMSVLEMLLSVSMWTCSPCLQGFSSITLD